MIGKIKNILESTKSFLQTPEEREQKQRKIINDMKISVEVIILGFCTKTNILENKSFSGKSMYDLQENKYKLKNHIDKTDFSEQIREKLQELDKRITLNNIGNSFTVFLSENTVKGSSHNTITNFTLE